MPARGFFIAGEVAVGCGSGSLPSGTVGAKGCDGAFGAIGACTVVLGTGAGIVAVAPKFGNAERIASARPGFPIVGTTDTVGMEGVSVDGFAGVGTGVFTSGAEYTGATVFWIG